MDGGEYISYTFGIYNPPTASDLTDVVAELVITGPAADKVTVFNPVAHVGAIEAGPAHGAGLHDLHRPEHRLRRRCG